MISVRSRLRVAIVLSTLLAAPGLLAAQDGLTKLDRQGPVTVAVTLLAPRAAGVPIRARIVLDTHSVALDGVTFEQAVVMRGLDGTDVAPTAVEQAQGAGHHRQAVVVFPPMTQTGPLRIVVKSVGGVAERDFVWE
jgi:hypothetical protein